MNVKGSVQLSTVIAWALLLCTFAQLSIAISLWFIFQVLLVFTEVAIIAELAQREVT